MADEHIYNASAGGGTGSGTTTGQTGQFIPDGSFDALDDKDYPLQDIVQEEALEEYDGTRDAEPLLPKEEEGEHPFGNLVHPPTKQSLQGTPTGSLGRAYAGQDLEPNKELENQIAQSVADNESIAAEDNDSPNREVS